MEKKKKPNWFLRILGVLFVIYMSLTIAINTGYYEAKLSEKTTITEENMKQFEEDVKKKLILKIMLLIIMKIILIIQVKQELKFLM